MWLRIYVSWQYLCRISDTEVHWLCSVQCLDHLPIFMTKSKLEWRESRWNPCAFIVTLASVLIWLRWCQLLSAMSSPCTPVWKKLWGMPKHSNIDMEEEATAVLLRAAGILRRPQEREQREELSSNREWESSRGEKLPKPLTEKRLFVMMMID